MRRNLGNPRRLIVAICNLLRHKEKIGSRVRVMGYARPRADSLACPSAWRNCLSGPSRCEDFAEYLKRTGVLTRSDFAAGIDMLSIPEGNVQDANFAVTALACELAGHEALAMAVAASPAPMRKVMVWMSVNKFFGLFRRLSIRISPGGLLGGQEVLNEDAQVAAAKSR